MAYELNKKIVIDTEEFNNFAVGITLPIQRGDDGYFRQSFKTFDQVRSNLKNLLLTKRGERILQPEFGSGLHDLLFNPATEKFEEDLENTINDAVAQWLPYIIVEDINIDISKEMTDNNQAKVSLKFRQEGDQTLDTLTFLVEE
jgi:phage baseplate assembly protein W